MLRSGAGPIPWFMTELQGGNNTYSGKRPLCPTKEEIAQWLWINIGSGSEGGMFWCLNPRKSGFEAGEWAMLDFHNEPTDRLLMASKVSNAISEELEFFDNFNVHDSGVSVLYTRESLWMEEALQIKGVELEGRMVGGVMKSALAYFEALSEMGLHPSFNEIGEFNFDKEEYLGQAIVLSHQISIPSKYWKPITDFVAKGGRLIVDGLTAYYDENGYCILGDDFPFGDCFGATIKEFKMVDNLFNLPLDDLNLSLTAHLWQGTLRLNNAIAIAGEDLLSANQTVYGCSNSFGKGKVVWIPSLLGLGSRICGEYKGLSKFLYQELREVIESVPLSFDGYHQGMLLKLIRNGDRFMSIMINKSGNIQQVRLAIKDLAFERIVFSSGQVKDFSQSDFSIDDEETLVVEWKAKA
jgi:beta-galactosidase